MTKAARAFKPKPNADKWEKVRCLRYGDFLRLFRYRYGSKGWHHFPDDSGGREDLWLLMLNTSLAVKEPERKMFCILDVWAPWMQQDERQEFVRHVWGMDLYQRIMTSREIGDALGLTNAEREALKLWQFKPIDMTDKQLAKQRKRKHNARQRAKRNRTRAEYLASTLSATKPWESEGISRRTWERRRDATRVRNNSSSACLLSCDTVQAESQIGYQKGDVPRDVVRKGRKVRERDRNASSPDALITRDASTEGESKLRAALKKDGIDGR